MRSASLVVITGIVLAFGPSASAGVFPDLPGIEVAENATSSRAGDATASSERDDASTEVGGRVPAPDSNAAAEEAVAPSSLQTVRRMPGGGSMPLIKEAAPAGSSGAPVAWLAALALAVVVLWTRFLVRLNSL